VSGGRHASTPRTVTGRAMAVLGAFSRERPMMGVQEISRRTGLPKSTTHRLVTELVQWGALTRGDERGDEYM
jgi:DNA-binding IclR family transcriptional regulator